MNTNDMSHEKLIIYCYDKRPDLYRRLTAKTTEAELRGWLHEPKFAPQGVSQQIINQAETITIGKQVVINNPTGPISF